MLGLVPTIVGIVCERAMVFRGISLVICRFVVVEAAAILYLFGIVSEETLLRMLSVAVVHSLFYVAKRADARDGESPVSPLSLIHRPETA